MKPKLKLLSALPAIIIMITIFLFSAQEATESSALSSEITIKIIDGIEKLVELDSLETNRIKFEELLETLIRKAAHMTEYAILAIAVAFFFYVYKKRSWGLFYYTIAICILYASSDEIHQVFVPGRSGQATDVLIDAIGAALGCLIFIWLSRVRKSNRFTISFANTRDNF